VLDAVVSVVVCVSVTSAWVEVALVSFELLDVVIVSDVLPAVEDVSEVDPASLDGATVVSAGVVVAGDTSSARTGYAVPDAIAQMRMRQRVREKNVI
jgi:hypothetical protein